MKTLALMTALAAFAATPAFAKTELQKDAESVASDAAAVHKDNVALDKQHKELAKDRAAKAAHKADDDYIGQAGKSVEIGAGHVAIGAKKIERSIDKQVLEHNKKDMIEDARKGEE